jgi:hypothetical protein
MHEPAFADFAQESGFEVRHGSWCRGFSDGPLAVGAMVYHNRAAGSIDLPGRPFRAMDSSSTL